MNPSKNRIAHNLLLAGYLGFGSCSGPTAQTKPEAPAPKTQSTSRTAAQTTAFPCTWVKEKDALCIPPSDAVLKATKRALPRWRDREEEGPQIARGTKVLDLMPGNPAATKVTELKEPASSILPMPDGSLLLAVRHALVVWRRDGSWESLPIAMPANASSVWPDGLLGYKQDEKGTLVQLTAYTGAPNVSRVPADPEEIYQSYVWEVRLSRNSVDGELLLQAPKSKLDELILPRCLSGGSKCLRCINNNSATNPIERHFVDSETGPNSGIFERTPLLSWESPIRDARWSADGRLVHVISADLPTPLAK